MDTHDNTALQDLIDTFDMLGDWEERYRYLIELGRKLPPMPDAEHDESHLVRGCMSQVWLAGDVGADTRMHLRGDSDAHIVKGLIALILTLTDGRTAQEVLDTDIKAAFAQLGLESHLSMNPPQRLLRDGRADSPDGRVDGRIGLIRVRHRAVQSG